MTKIVWVLNLTPDSFSDGRERSPGDAWKAIQLLIEDGADIIDVGAEATGPTSNQISEEEELTRLSDFFESAWMFEVPFSLDTMKSKVARTWLASWVKMINDVSWWRFDPEMYSIVADTDASYVMMYCKNPTWRADFEVRDTSKNILEIVTDFFDNRIEKALQAGITREQLILDPGMWSFVSTDPDDSRTLLRAIPLLKERYWLPVYIWTSRKWFLGKKSYDHWPKDRIWSTLASSVFALSQWASYIRVHDVRRMKQFLHIQMYLNNEK